MSSRKRPANDDEATSPSNRKKAKAKTEQVSELGTAHGGPCMALDTAHGYCACGYCAWATAAWTTAAWTADSVTDCVTDCVTVSCRCKRRHMHWYALVHMTQCLL